MDTWPCSMFPRDAPNTRCRQELWGNSCTCSPELPRNLACISRLLDVCLRESCMCVCTQVRKPHVPRRHEIIELYRLADIPVPGGGEWACCRMIGFKSTAFSRFFCSFCMHAVGSWFQKCHFLHVFWVFLHACCRMMRGQVLAAADPLLHRALLQMRHLPLLHLLCRTVPAADQLLHRALLQMWPPTVTPAVPSSASSSRPAVAPSTDVDVAPPSVAPVAPSGAASRSATECPLVKVRGLWRISLQQLGVSAWPSAGRASRERCCRKNWQPSRPQLFQYRMPMHLKKHGCMAAGVLCRPPPTIPGAVLWLRILYSCSRFFSAQWQGQLL